MSGQPLGEPALADILDAPQHLTPLIIVAATLCDRTNSLVEAPDQVLRRLNLSVSLRHLVSQQGGDVDLQGLHAHEHIGGHRPDSRGSNISAGACFDQCGELVRQRVLGGAGRTQVHRSRDAGVDMLAVPYRIPVCDDHLRNIECHGAKQDAVGSEVCPGDIGDDPPMGIEIEIQGTSQRRDQIHLRRTLDQDGSGAEQ